MIYKRTLLLAILTCFSIVSFSFAKETKNSASALKALIIIAPQNFQDQEFFTVQKALNKKKILTTIASSSTNEATGMNKGKVTPDISLQDLTVTDYDAIIFIGGTGSPVYYNDKNAHRIAQEALAEGKLLAAICLAPNILAKAGVLKDKKATCWESTILTECGSDYQKKNTIQDGNIITGNGPKASSKFAKMIIKALNKK